MIKSTFRRIFDTKVDALGLSVFRIAYTLVLFCEVAQLFKFRHLIYDQKPFVYVGDVDVTYIFVFWFVALAMLFLGLFTRTATILNYIFGVVIFSSAKDFEYHVFYAYVGINFLLMFMPISRVFSVDSLIQKIKYTNIGRPFKVDRKVLEINYLVPVFAGIGLVYFDSIFHKFSSKMWMDGLGMWMPSSLPMIAWNDSTFILNQEFLVRGMGYLVVIFETVFLFLFWFRKFRVPFFLLGIFFHLGILIAYPIPWFALTAVVTYLLMLPPDFWTNLSQRFKSKNTSYNFYYDAECPLCNKVVVMVRHFDVFNRINCVTVQGYAAHDPALAGIAEIDLLINIHGVDKNGRVYVGYDAYIALMKHMIHAYPHALLLSLPGISNIGKKIYRYVAGHRLTERCTSENCLMPEFAQPVPETEDFLISGWNRLAITKRFWTITLIALGIMQLTLIGVSPSIQRLVKDNAVGKGLVSLNKAVRTPMQKTLGITQHPVFMYNIHFEGYNHIFKIVCNNNGKAVPLLDNDGLVTNSYANGALWVNYTFRVNSPLMKRSLIESGTERYLRYFQNQNDLAESDYTIYVKEIETTDHWQKDFLRNQMKKPWEPAGSCKLTKRRADFVWNGKMQAIFDSENKLH